MTNMESKRILAIDHGTKRIGMAITDPTGVMTLVLPVLERKDDAKDFAAIRNVVAEKGVGLVVVGLPLNTDDTAGPRAKAADEFARALETELGVPVETFDERYTTQQAESMLAGVPLSRKKKRAHVNSVAAQVLLESYLHAAQQRSDRG